MYVELNQQIAALLNAGDEEDLVELKALQQQLSDVCYRQASQLEFRQNLLQAALEFHGVAQDVSKICTLYVLLHENAICRRSVDKVVIFRNNFAQVVPMSMEKVLK